VLCSWLLLLCIRMAGRILKPTTGAGSRAESIRPSSDCDLPAVRLPLSPRRCPALSDDDDPCMLLGKKKKKKENVLVLASCMMTLVLLIELP
jgi:hypothetical protein